MEAKEEDYEEKQFSSFSMEEYEDKATKKEEGTEEVETPANAMMPDGKKMKKEFGDLFQTSPISLWFPEMVSIATMKKDFRQQISYTYLDARYALALFGTINGLWECIKHGVNDRETIVYIEEQLDTLDLSCKKIGERIQTGKPAQRRAINLHINRVRHLFSALNTIMAGEKLLIRFTKSQLWKGKLIKFDANRDISGNE